MDSNTTRTRTGYHRHQYLTSFTSERERKKKRTVVGSFKWLEIKNSISKILWEMLNDLFNIKINIHRKVKSYVRWRELGCIPVQSSVISWTLLYFIRLRQRPKNKNLGLTLLWTGTSNPLNQVLWVIVIRELTEVKLRPTDPVEDELLNPR